LTRSASRNANHNSANGSAGHDEAGGRPYFTGATAQERISQEFPSPDTNEVAAAFRDVFPRCSRQAAKLFQTSRNCVQET